MLRTLVSLGLRTSVQTKGLLPSSSIGETSDSALQTAKLIRGIRREPAIIIHGVMARSGTVYVGELLRLHPGLYAYPNKIWEIPFLQLTDDILKIQECFFRAYIQNVGKIKENDFLPLFGASFIAYLYSYAPHCQRILLKIASVEYLDHFYSVFPHEHLLLLMRDGRDVVSSTIKTWPNRLFSDVCERWNYSARMMISFHEKNSDRSAGYWIAKYEDAVRDPVAFAKKACERFDLAQDIYPLEKIRYIPVRGSSSLKQGGKVTWAATDKPENFESIGHWQTWSAYKKRTFKRIAGQALVDAGYCDNLDW